MKLWYSRIFWLAPSKGWWRDTRLLVFYVIYKRTDTWPISPGGGGKKSLFHLQRAGTEKRTRYVLSFSFSWPFTQDGFQQPSCFLLLKWCHNEALYPHRKTNTLKYTHQSQIFPCCLPNQTTPPGSFHLAFLGVIVPWLALGNSCLDFNREKTEEKVVIF